MSGAVLPVVRSLPFMTYASHFERHLEHLPGFTVLTLSSKGLKMTKIVFVHGTFQNPESWDHRLRFFGNAYPARVV